MQGSSSALLHGVSAGFWGGKPHSKPWHGIAIQPFRNPRGKGGRGEEGGVFPLRARSGAVWDNKSILKRGEGGGELNSVDFAGHFQPHLIK